MIEKAVFRKAKPYEVEQARGGIVWRCISAIANFAVKLLGTLELTRVGGNVLRWHRPFPLWVTHNIKWLFGKAPERSFLRTFPSFFGTWHFIDSSEKVLEAYYKHARNSELFSNSISFEKLFEIIRDTFKEPGFNRNDFLFTAQEDIAKMYHDMTVRFLTGPRLGECRAFIKNACKETLESWATQGKEGKSVNITQETRNFASKVITHLAFGETQQNKGIGEAINFINLHISKKTFGKATKADEVEYEKKLKLLKELINEILDSSAELPMFKGLDPQLNRAQKQALMFIYLFGGQETVASLLNYLLLTLGQDKDLQAKLKTEVNQKKNNEDLTLLDSIRQLFVKGIRDFTPAYGITSQAKEDICLKFTVDGRKYKYIFFKGEKISAMTINHADAQPKQPDDYSAWKPFAEGPRRCPGEKLAKIEILEFIVQALKGYVIDVPSDYKAVKRGAITLQLVDDVLAKVVKG